MNKIALVVLVCVLLQLPASAEVADSTASGFTIKITTNLRAAPADVYRKILQVGQWWNSAHTFSGDAHNLSIEERAGGCYCEKLPNGGSVRHAEVVFLAPGKRIRLYGGLGPFQAMAAAGPLNFELVEAEGGTKLELTYTVSGYSPDGLDKLAPIANQVLTEQITRLKNYIETGSPAGKTAEPKR